MTNLLHTMLPNNIPELNMCDLQGDMVLQYTNEFVIDTGSVRF